MIIKKVLIANRGEIAIRIIRSCHYMGIKTVAIYSEVDSNSLHVKIANEAICIGKDYPGESYLRIDRILSAALISNADAIHPGYGFLSENADFVEQCEKLNIKFIGPNFNTIKKLSNKSIAKNIAKQSGCPIIPGSIGNINSYEELLNISMNIGFPVLIKATMGGGGKGMRIVYNQESLLQEYNVSMIEAKNSFGCSEVYIEKYLENPRHIEVQILGDQYGNIIHLGDRDCSIQRRYQKLIEESLSSSINDDLRKKIHNAAIKIAKYCNYENAGTIEFLVDNNDNFYFIEINTRIQVEHGISEEITGIDILQEQINIASGIKLKWNQKDISFNGYAIECRINAEDPYNNFIPSTGNINFYYQPGGKGIRIDSAVSSNFTVYPYYDSLISKLITYGSTRQIAISKMQQALFEYKIEGIKTTIPFLSFIFKNKNFINGKNINTSFIKEIISNFRSN